MGNFSRNPQQELNGALDRDYVRVRFQQGKPALDRELNLAADLASPQRLAAAYVGNGIAGTGDDFAISGLSVPQNNFSIAAGRALVNGLEAVLRANTTYRTQPIRTNVVNALPAGQSNVYLRVFTREVSGQEDAGLLNPGDVGFETAVRDKVEWEVIVSAAVINQPDHLPLAVINTSPAGVTDRRRTGVSVATLGDRMNAAHEANGALRPNSVAAPQIVNGSVGRNELASGAVSLAQIETTRFFSANVMVAANSEASVTFFQGRRHASMLVSVNMIGLGTVSWRESAIQITQQGNQVHFRGIMLRNESTTAAANVEVEAFEIVRT